MGIMKRIATELQLHANGKPFSRFAPAERAAIRAITRSSEALLKYLAEEAAPKPTAGGMQLSAIWLGAVYTGTKPAEAGIYCVIDTVSETREMVKLLHIDRREWMVNRIGSDKTISLVNFNKKTYHWFQMSELSTDDMKFVKRELP